MPKPSSRSELHASDSPVSWSLDSSGAPSEPPDIRSWFPSYAYESPGLNTLDGLRDLDGSEDEQPVDKSNDGLLCADNIGPVEMEHSVPAALVPGGSSESLLFSSEPPDIKNWFSSYFYESPPLDSPLDFTVTDFEVRKDGKVCKSGKQDNKDGILIGVEERKEFPTQIRTSNVGVKCINLVKDINVDYQPVDKVTGSSESLSFSSEPPDIKNWFSSYLYESPPLDSTLDFTITDYKVREDGKVCKSGKLDNKDGILIGVEESKEFSTQIRASNVGVKCIDSVTDIKVDYQSVDKDACENVALKPTSSILSLLTSEFVYKKILPGQRTMNNAEKLGDTNTYGKDYDVKLECSLSERTNPMENNIDSPNGKYVFKSVGRKDRVRNNLEKKDPCEIASFGNLDSTVAKDNSWSRPADSRSMRKETELVENGFVSTRKRSKENAVNATNMPPQVQIQSLRREVKPALKKSRTDASINRKVLSEISNNSSPAILESSGKWCCPQKNKRNLGPPLKQLRLEQWVRRV